MSRRFQFSLVPGLRLQYGLRSLLLAMLAVCLVLGWHVERVRRQREAVAALTEAKAQIEYYESSNPAPLWSVDDVETPLTVGERIERLMPERLRSALGTDFFRPVDQVGLAHLAKARQPPDRRLLASGLFARSRDPAARSGAVDLWRAKLLKLILVTMSQ